MNITVKLSSGKTIELTMEEAKELFSEKQYQLIQYPVLPSTPTYPTGPSYPYVVTCGIAVTTC